MKGSAILAVLLVGTSQSAMAASYLDTTIGDTGARIKVEDCGKKICGTISIGGHRFLLKGSKESDVSIAPKDPDFRSNGKSSDSEKAKPPVAKIENDPPPIPTSPGPSAADTKSSEPTAAVSPRELRQPTPPNVESAAPEKQQLATSDPTSPIGEWTVEDGVGRVQLRACGAALCGVVSAAKNPNDTDRHNPDASKRSRPVIGMPVLLDMKPTKPNRWEGRIYNAEDGRTYTANISLKDPNVLRVEGCAFGGLFCGGQNWTRVKEMPQG